MDIDTQEIGLKIFVNFKLKFLVGFISPISLFYFLLERGKHDWKKVIEFIGFNETYF